MLPYLCMVEQALFEGMGVPNSTSGVNETLLSPSGALMVVRSYTGISRDM